MYTCAMRTSDGDKMNIRAAVPRRWCCCCNSAWLTTADTASTQTLTVEWLTSDEYRLHTSTCKQPTTRRVHYTQPRACIPHSTSAKPMQLTWTTVCPKKSEPLNILQQQPQICSDSNKILHTQDDIWYKHYCIVSYKSALTLLKYEFLNNITHKSWVSFAVDVSQNSQNVHSSKRPVSSRKFNH